MARCEQIPMLSLHHDGRLSATQRAAIEAHVATCAECADELAALRAMSAALRQIASPIASPEFIRSLQSLSDYIPDATVWRFAARLTGMAAAILLLAICRLALIDTSAAKAPADLTADERRIVDPEYAIASVGNSNSDLAVLSADVPIELTTMETPGARP